ncbi:MAG: LysR family transcriptional regulator [Burkholderiales bacterium]|nr:LysR family transcriptional regulator [Burkholderiales bacterium]
MTQAASALQDIALFVEVARMRSFSGAARNLGLSTATLSRRIGAFEQEMGSRLFNRTTRRVELTSVGERYFERCNHLVDEARRAREALFSEAQRPSGHLRLSMPVDLGVTLIGPMLPSFARLYPGVSFEVDLSPRHRDLVAEPVDVALRLGTVRDAALISRRVGWMDQGLFASARYLERRGAPAQPSDLVGHDCIFVGGGKSSATWRFEREGSRALSVTVRGRFSVNNHALMRTLAERDIGIAALAPSLCREAIGAGRLMPVLGDWTVPRLGVFAVTTSRLQSAIVRAFVDFVAERFAAS